ncbi:MAG: diguanylate cyclase domain-containing protein [Burkholderiales bacterium]|jgi:diguanylate cyclase (GGDEF)-like protein
MTALSRAARTFGWRPNTAQFAPRRTLGWVALAGAAVAALAAWAGAAFRDSPTLLGAVLLVAAVATVSLTFQGLAARILARLDAAVTERDTFQTELVAARKTREEWRNLAYHDDLTGLPNRSLLLDRLGLAIAHSRRLASHLALVFLDLDDFKSVNDSFGHGTGDRLLVELATRVRASVRAGDTVARFGGDELVVLLDSVTGSEDAAHVAAKVLAAVQAPFRLDGHEIRVAASIGVSVYPGDGTSPAELVSRADAAMYRHKRRERGAPMARDEAFQEVIG